MRSTHRQSAFGAGLLFAALAFGSIAAGQPADAPADSPPPEGLQAVASIEQAFMDVIERCEKSVVAIARVRRMQLPEFKGRLNPLDGGFRQPALDFERSRPGSPDFVPNEFGTGILIAAEGRPEIVVLTNYHVVRGGQIDGQPPDSGKSELYVRFANRLNCRARILAADPRSDLAVLRLDESDLGPARPQLEPMRLGDGGALRKGQLVIALGNPYAIARDGSASASWGIVSNIGRRPAPVAASEEEIDEQTIHHFGTLLQVDTRLNLGTSGGALLNFRGELVGVTTALAALEGYEQSVGYAIPVDEATRRVIQSLAQGYEVEYGFLGVQTEDVSADQLRRTYSLPFPHPSAAKIEVFPNSPAGLGGLQSEDLVLEVDGRPVYDRYDLMRYVGRAAPGSTIRLRVWRRGLGRELVCDVRLGKWPVRNEDEIIATVPRYPAWRGLQIDYPTSRYKYFPFPYQIPQAVLVIGVEPQSSGAAAEIHPGDFISHVNGVPVETPAEFQRAVGSVEGDAALQLIDGRTVTVSP